MTTFARTVITQFREETLKVDGWLEDIDCFIFHALLSYQTGESLQGDLLEVGVYQGKSAILLGMHLQGSEKMHACDIFDNQTDPANKNEIVNSYSHFSREIFLRNYTKVIKSIPEVYACASSELGNLLTQKKFRFIHIDGSHLYEHVIKDLILASTLLEEQFGVIAVDDFRAEHAIGVSSAMWEMIYFHGLKPLILSSSKAYLVPISSKLTLEIIEKVLKSYKIQSELVSIRQFNCLRVHNLSHPIRKSFRDSLKMFLPPIVVNLARVARNQISTLKS